MIDEKNALAKLSAYLAMYRDFHKDEDRVNYHILTKAQRIVAELSKVIPNYMAGKPGHSFIETEAYKAYRNCYAIAEERVKDDK